jgi:hypothetical protein
MLGKKMEKPPYPRLCSRNGELRSIEGLLTASETNMTVRGPAQGKESRKILRIVAIYYGKHEMITPDRIFRIKMNIDGKVLPFT